MTSIISLPQGKVKRDQKHQSKKQRKGKVVQDQRVDLIDSIKLTQNRLKQAYSCFHQTTDPDLVDSYVYEINALKARHNYLSKQLREG